MNERIKELYQKYGITRSDILKAGLSYQAFYSCVTGTRRMKYDTLLRFQDRLGIPIWELRPDLWKSREAREN